VYTLPTPWPPIAPPKAVTPIATTPVKKPTKPAAKTAKPARSAPKRAATPKRKAAKRRTKQANRQTERVESKLVNAGLARLRAKYPEKYLKGFSSKMSPAVLIRQMGPFWAEICKAEDVSPEDHPLKKMWDTVARAIGRRKRQR
jgi:hypothetical protein